MTLLAAAAGGSVGLGVFILAVGFLMAGGAAISLRSVWSRPAAREDPLPRQGPLPKPPSRSLRSAQLGEFRGVFRLLMSFDFGCLALVSVVLVFLGLVLILRATNG